MEQLQVEIGKRIKHVRKLRGMNQEDLAEFVGLTRSSIANLEVGRQNMRITTLYQFAYALDCSVTDLLAPGFWQSLWVPEFETSQFTVMVDGEIIYEKDIIVRGRYGNGKGKLQEDR